MYILQFFTYYLNRKHIHEFINLTVENIDIKRICCDIGDPKHQCGVNKKKEWIKSKLKDWHVPRKLNDRGKIFIEYEPIKTVRGPVFTHYEFYDSDDVVDANGSRLNDLQWQAAYDSLTGAQLKAALSTLSKNLSKGLKPQE